jgi:hypothetical protein
MANKQYYKYVITLDAPLWPRKLADELSYARGVFPHLVSVTDLQTDGHIYGDTYTIRRDRVPATGEAA